MLAVLPYMLVNSALIFLYTCLRNVIYCRTLPMRWPRGLIWGCSLFFTLLWTCNNYLFENGSAILDSSIILLFLFGTPLFVEKGYRLKGVFTALLFMIIEIGVMSLVAIAAYPVVQYLGYPVTYLVDRTTSFGNAIMILICMPGILLCSWVTSLLLRKMFSDRNLSIWILCFLPIPISQSVTLNLFNRIRPFADGVKGLDGAFLLAFLISAAADIGFFYGVMRVQKSEQLRQQVRFAEEQLQIQSSYYRQLQDSILTINQVRHDLTNQLQAAYALLASGEHAESRSHLDQLQAYVQDQVGPRFCPNLLVDAVLSDKYRLCQAQGIRLDINAQLPQELPIESTHLCSAFSNLLDNSVQAVQDQPEKYIELRTTLHADYLIIGCTNPSAPPSGRGGSKDLLRLHGLGLDILRRIAKEYHGSLDTQYRDGLYEAVLILRFS